MMGTHRLHVMVIPEEKIADYEAAMRNWLNCSGTIEWGTRIEWADFVKESYVNYMFRAVSEAFHRKARIDAGLPDDIETVKQDEL